MSLLSALAFLASAIGAKRPKIERDPIDVEIIAHLQTEIDDLRRQAYERECRIADLSRELLLMQMRRYQPVDMQNFGQALDEYVRNCTPGRHELLRAANPS